MIESVGGKLESFYFSLGHTHAYIVADFPDNESAVAVSLAVSTGGGVTVRTVQLFAGAEVDAAANKKTTYRPPGS